MSRILHLLWPERRSAAGLSASVHPRPLANRRSVRSRVRGVGSIAMALGLSAALGSHAALAADPVAKSEAKLAAGRAPAPATPEIPQSVFLVGSATQDTKDPFFPNSTRLNAQVTKTSRTNITKMVIAADLSLKAILGTPDQPLATINNTTFGVGEVQDVATPLGRVRVRCVEIRLQDESVIIETAGSRRVLRFSRSK